MDNEHSPGMGEEAMEHVVELIDEDGQTVQFEHLMTLPYEGEEYVVLTLDEPTPDSEEGEVFILRIDTDEQGEDCYVSLEDEAVEQAVFDLFMEQIEALEAEDVPESE